MGSSAIPAANIGPVEDIPPGATADGCSGSLRADRRSLDEELPARSREERDRLALIRLLRRAKVGGIGGGATGSLGWVGE